MLAAFLLANVGMIAILTGVQGPLFFLSAGINFAGFALLFWHLTYLALVMGSPSRIRRGLAAVSFATALPALLLSNTLLYGTGLGKVIESWGVVSVFLVVGLAGTGLARVFKPGSRLAILQYAFLAWFGFIASFFYFRQAHDKQGRPRPIPDEFAPVISFPPPDRDRTADYLAFWARFRRATGHPAEAPRYVDAFGDSREMHDELLALVLSRTKQATASLARWYTEDELPKVGDLSLVTDGRGAPACVIRTVRVDIMPVRKVGAEFAFAEGEGDRSYDYWITEHRKFWTREAEREGFEYSDDLDVVCERFELVWARG